MSPFQRWIDRGHVVPWGRWGFLPRVWFDAEVHCWEMEMQDDQCISNTGGLSEKKGCFHPSPPFLQRIRMEGIFWPQLLQCHFSKCSQGGAAAQSTASSIQAVQEDEVASFFFSALASVGSLFLLSAWKFICSLAPFFSQGPAKNWYLFLTCHRRSEVVIMSPKMFGRSVQ